MRLHQMQDSKNNNKVRLTLAHLSLNTIRADIDILTGELRTQVVLTTINDNRQVPMLKLDDGIAPSRPNAIALYVTQDSEIVPVDRLQKAQTLQWTFLAQYSHERPIVNGRFWRPILNDEVGHAAQIHETNSSGYAAIGIIERHLATRGFFKRDFFSADIAVYA